MAIPDDGPLLLGIDVGTSRTKVALVDAGGAEVAHAAVATPFAATPSGGVEASVDDLLRGVGAVVGRLGPARGRVTAVGVAGVAESGTPVD
ncbi:MAG: FGGY-family carbohydrate kinase, partial [Acidimicrobiales bacterium]